MEQLNLSWFNAINAGSNLHGYQLGLSIFLAKYLVYVVILCLLGLWLWGAKKHRNTLVLALCAVIIAFLINWLIGLIWFHPRPFVLGIGNTYLHHAPNSSFPSDHFTGLCTIFLIFLWRERINHLIVLILMLTMLSVAWARVFVGVHFPFDMLGGFVVALFAAGSVIYYSDSIQRWVLPCIENAYQRLFAPIIQKKWVNN